MNSGFVGLAMTAQRMLGGYDNARFDMTLFNADGGYNQNSHCRSLQTCAELLLRDRRVQSSLRSIISQIDFTATFPSHHFRNTRFKSSDRHPSLPLLQPEPSLLAPTRRGPSYLKAQEEPRKILRSHVPPVSHYMYHNDAYFFGHAPLQVPECSDAQT